MATWLFIHAGSFGLDGLERAGGVGDLGGVVCAALTLGCVTDDTVEVLEEVSTGACA